MPEGAAPTFALQLSSPVEEITITQLFDPLNETAEGSLAAFAGVEISTATLTVAAKDADIPLGVSAPQDVSSLCQIQNVMDVQAEYVKETTIDIVPEASTTTTTTTTTEATTTETATETMTETPATETKPDAVEPAVEESKDEAPAEPKAEEESTAPPPPTEEAAATPEPVCRVTFRATYKPSAKDQREELYDLLNKASQKKAKALERLRTSATTISRLAPSTAMTMAAPASSSSSKAVQKGFLNKGAKKPSAMMQWYNRYFGPRSLARQVFPVAKNYLIFFGVVALFHFRGQELALPPPV